MFKRRKNNQNQSQTKHLITQINPRSTISEQYRTLRTNIEFSSVDKKLKSILATSASPSEGKSTTTVNLANVYVQQGKRVLIIDADMRKPTLHYTFRLNNIRGLSNVLVGESALETVIQSSGIDNFDAISSGPIPPNPSELLGSNRMKKLIEEATTLYDLVVFDTPPLLAVADAQILADAVDGSILVVRSGKTEQEHAIKAKETLELASAKMLGVVLNGREKNEMTYYYYYGQSK